MLELDTLRRAVIAEPEDDTVRLAFADCLEDLGEIRRASFIRVSIEAARVGEGREKQDLLKQMAELAPTRMDFDPWEVSTDKTPATNELMGGKYFPFRLVAYYPLELTFHRGFVSAIMGSVHAIKEYWRVIGARHPVQVVSPITTLDLSRGNYNFHRLWRLHKYTDVWKLPPDQLRDGHQQMAWMFQPFLKKNEIIGPVPVPVHTRDT